MNQYSKHASIYKSALRLYPKNYRRTYEDEMLCVFEDMMQGITNRNERNAVLLRTLREIIPWIIKERAKAVSDVVNAVPSYVKKSFIASGMLLAPFLFIDAHNDFQTKIYKDSLSPLFLMISHFWYVYALYLPLIALVITASVALRYVKPHMTEPSSIALVSRKVISAPMIATVFLGLIEIHILL